jgi:hypothetical protein
MLQEISAQKSQQEQQINCTAACMLRQTFVTRVPLNTAVRCVSVRVVAQAADIPASVSKPGIPDLAKF